MFDRSAANQSIEIWQDYSKKKKQEKRNFSIYIPLLTLNSTYSIKNYFFSDKFQNANRLFFKI